MSRHGVSVSETLENPSPDGRNRPQSQLTGNQPPLHCPKCAENPFPPKAAASSKISSRILGPYIRDEEILDSIKTHVLKKMARIGRFRRFTWRVRCERHRRFCRSS